MPLQVVKPDLGPNYLQRLSADDTSRQRVNDITLLFMSDEKSSFLQDIVLFKCVKMHIAIWCCISRIWQWNRGTIFILLRRVFNSKITIVLGRRDTKESTCLLWDITTEKSGLCCYAVRITQNTYVRK